MISDVLQRRLADIDRTARASASRKERKDTPAKTFPTDILEISQKPAAANGIREDLINAVKQRLKSGFYESDAVIDDLSSSFAGAFNQRP